MNTPYVTMQRFVEGQEMLGLGMTVLPEEEVIDPIEPSTVVFEDQELPVHSVPFPLVSTNQHSDDDAQDMTDWYFPDSGVVEVGVQPPLGFQVE